MITASEKKHAKMNFYRYLISQRMFKELVANIVKAKYYSVALGCTPDISQVAVGLEFKWSEISKYKVHVRLRSTEATNFAYI